MSRPKPFLEPDAVYARLVALERTVKALATTPRTGVSAITVAEIDTLEVLNSLSNSWRDLATPGPSVTVNATTTGTVLVIASAFQTAPATAGGAVIAAYGIRVDAADPVQPSTGTIDKNTAYAEFEGMASGAAALRSTIVTTYTGLSVGPHTFKMRYLWQQGAAGLAEWSSRLLVAIPI